MALTRTLAQLQTSVQMRGQLENSADITPAVLTELVNEGIAECYDILVEKWDDLYTQVAPAFTLIASQDTYPLPPDFYKLRKVELLSSTASSHWSRLYPHDLSASSSFSVQGLVASRYRYRLQAGAIVFVPMPGTTAAQVRLWYIPHAPVLVNPTDTFDGINGYEELAIQLAYRRCLVRQELSTAMVDGEVARLIARVKTAADARDASEPFYLDARGPQGGGWGDDEGGMGW